MENIKKILDKALINVYTLYVAGGYAPAKRKKSRMKMKNKKLSEKVKDFFTWGEYHPTHRVGSGRYSANHTYKGWLANDTTGEIPALADLGLKFGRHYTTGNDAPRGGACGFVVKLTAAGRRLKIVKAARAAVKAGKND